MALHEPAETVRAFAKEFGIRFPLWIDPDGRGPAAFGVYGHPATILVDRAGRVVGRARGERDWATDDARRLVEALPCQADEARSGNRDRPADLTAHVAD